MQCIRVEHRRVGFSLKHADFSLGFQQLNLCFALKETLRVFSVSANWPAGQAAGPQQPAAAAMNIKYSLSASITSSLHLVFSINTSTDEKTRQRLRNESNHSTATSFMSEILWAFTTPGCPITVSINNCSTHRSLWLWPPSIHTAEWLLKKLETLDAKWRRGYLQGQRFNYSCWWANH